MRRALLILFCLLPAVATPADITVHVNGIEEKPLRENVLAFLGIYQYRDKEGLTEAMVRRLHSKAPQEIRRALMPFGYYRPAIEAHLQVVEGDWVATYDVQPGPPVRVSAVRVGILAEPDVRRLFEDILSNPPIRSGNVLKHAEYDALKSALMNRATQHGFLDASFETQRLEVNTDTLDARVELALQPGLRYYFGDVEIHQDILDEDFVRRFVKFETGDPLNFNELLDLQYALTDSEYFTAVQVEPLRDQAGDDRHIPIVVRADPNERSRYSVGLGYGTDTGPRLTLGFQRRYVNRRGHKLSVESRIAEVESSFTTRYTIPLEEPARESLQLFAGTIRADRADTESDRLVVGASRLRTLGDWEQTLYLRAEKEISTLPTREFETRSLIPGASWLKTEADDLFYTRRGYKLYADVHGSAPVLGAETEYVQVRVLGKQIFAPAEDWRVLLRAEAGATAVGKRSNLPVSQRFFAGGDYSVRGFDYNSIGPPDDSGKVVGGQYLVAGSAELEYRFAENWAVATFVDAGNATNDLGEELRRAYGVGLRWISPVGVVRLDLAHPINADPPPARGIEIHISVGPDL